MENDVFTRVKIAFTAACTVMWQWLGTLTLPVVLLLVAQLLDYYTAIKAAPYRNQTIDSAKSIHGITKKVSMLLLVCVGIMLDLLLLYAADYIGFTPPFKLLISCLIAVWLRVNEIISILENIKDVLGDNMPSFLLPLVKNIRSQVDKKMELEESEEK